MASTTKELIYSKNYPEYSTYHGTAYHNASYLEQIDIINLEWLIPNVIEYETNLAKTVLL